MNHIKITDMLKMYHEGSGINILYSDTLKKMNVPLTDIHPHNTSFHDTVFGMKEKHTCQITFDVVPGNPYNFQFEKPCFEVAAKLHVF